MAAKPPGEAPKRVRKAPAKKAAERPLRSVSAAEVEAAEQAAAKKTQSLADAIAGGVYLEILEAQQRQMATDVGQMNGPAKAAIYRQLALISKEIEQLRVIAAEDAKGAGGDGNGGTPEDEAFDPEAI